MELQYNSQTPTIQNHGTIAPQCDSHGNLKVSIEAGGGGGGGGGGSSLVTSTGSWVNATLTTSGVDQNVLGANSDRIAIQIINHSTTATIWASFHGTANASQHKYIELLPGDMWENPPNWCPSGALHMVADDDNVPYAIIEGVP